MHINLNGQKHSQVQSDAIAAYETQLEQAHEQLEKLKTIALEEGKGKSELNESLRQLSEEYAHASTKAQKMIDALRADGMAKERQHEAEISKASSR